MRLDIYLVEDKHMTSRSLAQDAIKEERVLVNGNVVTKASFKVSNGDVVDVLEAEQVFASRGGLKLYGALNEFKINVQDKVVLDVGASTGGFSDVCLQLGAKHVYAVDVGSNQLIDRLRQDKRLTNIENFNAKQLESSMFDEEIDLICMDVSFISIKQLLDAIIRVSSTETLFILLIKPQFEVERSFINKQGIVKNRQVHRHLLRNLIPYFEDHQLKVKGMQKASVSGRGGNQEYVVYLSRQGSSKHINIQEIV